MSLKNLCVVFITLFLFSCASHQGENCHNTIANLHNNHFTTVNNPSSIRCNRTSGASGGLIGSADYRAAQCSFEKGMFAGQHGEAATSHCAGLDLSEYHHGYTMGQDVYQANGRLAQISTELESARHQLWSLTNSGKPLDADEIGKLEDDIVRLENARRDESDHLIRLRADLSTR